jgi:hypothetical protein
MADIIQIKRSLVTGTVPGAGSLAEGEMAINIADKKGWIGDTSGDPVLIIDNGVQIVNAVDVVYDNSTSGLTATNVQAAIDELVTNLGNHTSDTNNPHNTNWGNLGGIPATFPPEQHGHDGGTF